jgi:hypothetical protein
MPPRRAVRLSRDLEIQSCRRAVTDYGRCSAMLEGAGMRARLSDPEPVYLIEDLQERAGVL